MSEAPIATGAAPVPRARLAAAAAVVLAGFAVVGAGGFIMGGGLGGTTAADPPELDAGDVGSRAGDLDDGAADGMPEEEGASGPAAGAPPVDDAFAARLAEEEARLAERARLASDSPLTPPVADADTLVERWREAGADPGPAPAVPGRAAPGSAPAPAPPEETPPPSGDGTDTPAFVLARGSVIPAVLESPIDSDLPGLVRARVAETVRDTLTGAHVLIPRGSWLTGSYGSGTGAGQRRLFVSWTDLLLPDGTPVPLGGTGSLGADGASGVRGRRSTGLWTALGAAVLFDLAGNASDLLIARETGRPRGAATGWPRFSAPPRATRCPRSPGGISARYWTGARGSGSTPGRA